MSERHPTQDLYAKALAEAAAMDADQADYFALNQGEYGTNLRHAAAALERVEGLTGNVLDLGCGTGLFLDKMIEQGIRPEYYLGMDGMAERPASMNASPGTACRGASSTSRGTSVSRT